MNKNPIGRKALSLLLSFALILSVFGVDTAGAFAAQSSTPTTLYLDSGNIIIDGTTVTQNGRPVTRGPQDSGYLITQNSSTPCTNTITVQSGTQNIILQNVQAQPTHGCAFELKAGANADITLLGSNLLDTSQSFSYSCAGLSVYVGSTVHISGSGSLTAIGGGSCAGIGGKYDVSCGTVEISGGTIKATGSGGGAGIGGGYNGSGGSITISGGTVNATGSSNGAGIGGGCNGDGGSITISGGTVNAIGDTDGAGIGGGGQGTGGNVTISGAGTQVFAQGDIGYDIGSGERGSSSGSLTVSDGAVVAMVNRDPKHTDVMNPSYKDCKIIKGSYETTYGRTGNVTATQSVLYIDDGSITIDNDGFTMTGNDHVSYSEDYLIAQRPSGAATPNTITVTGGTHNITIWNFNIDVSGTDHTCAFSIAQGAAVNLTLEGTNTLQSGPSCAGLAVPGNANDPQNNASLTITGGGSLTATGGLSSAGIGGDSSQSCGTVQISGGTVTATGAYGAGIGGGHNGAGGSITISGGIINATGSLGGAGIGGGDNGAGGTITISSGTVNATGISGGAGIGGGNNGAGGTITISGGTVTATGGEHGAGIGGGDNGAGGTITVSGSSTVTTTGGGGGAGVGGGNQGAGGTITIGGSSTVTATGGSGQNGTYGGAGIGGGDKGNGGTIIIGGSSTVTATSGVGYAGDGSIIVGSSGAGVGGGNSGTGGTITIGGSSTVTATSQHGGAGIGGGTGGDNGGTITVNGGTVTATSMWGGAGIGGGFNCSGGTIAVSGGTVMAIGGENGAGIGGGGKGNGGTIAVSGGTVTAAGGDSGAGVGGGNRGAGGTVVISGMGTLVSAKGQDGGSDIGSGSGSSDGGSLTVGDSGNAVPPPTVEFLAAGTNASNPQFKNCVIMGVGAKDTAGNAIGGSYDASGRNTNHPSQTPQPVSGGSPSLPSSVTEPSTGAQVDLSGAIFPAGVTSVSFSVTKPAQGDKQAAAFRTVLLTDPKTGVINIPEICSLSLLDQNGKPVTFTGSVTVRLPLPSVVRGTPHVFRYEPDTKTFTDMNAKVENGFLVFSTTHFSDYVIAGVGNAITLDTLNYQMPVNGSYQIGIQLAGTKAASVKFHSTNDKIATVVKMKNGNYQVNGKGTGTAYIMFDVYDEKNKFLTHASVRIEVKTGVHPRGDSTRQVGLF